MAQWRVVGKGVGVEDLFVTHVEADSEESAIALGREKLEADADVEGAEIRGVHALLEEEARHPKGDSRALRKERQAADRAARKGPSRHNR